MDDLPLMDRSNPLDPQFTDPDLRAGQALLDAWREALFSSRPIGAELAIEMSVGQSINYAALGDALTEVRKAAAEIDGLRRQIARAWGRYDGQKAIIGFLVEHLPPPAPAAPLVGPGRERTEAEPSVLDAER